MLLACVGWEVAGGPCRARPRRSVSPISLNKTTTERWLSVAGAQRYAKFGHRADTDISIENCDLPSSANYMNLVVYLVSPLGLEPQGNRFRLMRWSDG